jgi:hypothetical protein
MLVFSSAAVLPAFAVPNRIYITTTAYNFDTATNPVGYKFNVTLKMELDQPAYSWQVKMYFPAWLRCNKAGYAGAGAADSGKSEYFAGLTTVPLSPSINTLSVLHGESLQGAISAPAADKYIMWAEMEIISAPGKYGELLGSLDINNVDTYALDTNLDEISINKEGASLSYLWTLPPLPHLAVVPALVEFDELPPSKVGELFDVEIFIEGLDAAWNCHNISFKLTWDNTLIDIDSFVIDPAWTTGSVSTVSPGTIDVFVEAFVPPPPYGDVLIITITFEVLYQGTYPDVDSTDLILSDIIIWDTLQTIDYTAPEHGEVIINGLLTLPLPHLEVSDVTMGPGPARGERFNVTVSIVDLHPAWYLIGVDFRMSYNETLMTPVAAYEGPFLPGFAALQPGSLGTFFVSYWETNGGFGIHVLAGNLIYPNATGWWHDPFPNGTGVIAIFEFEVAYQSFGDPDQCCNLTILEESWVGIDSPDTQNIVSVPHDDPVNGVYCITTDWPGRVIDVYTQYPAPFGGQGIGMPSDMFWPQKEVCLYANVTYNYWPVQQKDVAFEVRDPSGTLWAVLVGRTDVDGVAEVCFRIPWPCDNPEDLFGVWTITATVDIACIVVNDTLEFHFDYLVHMFKVSTDLFEYNHCQWVEVTIEYGTHAQQYYPLVLYVVIIDELGVPVAITYIETEVGGTRFCEYKNYTSVTELHVLKFAFAGIAEVIVTALNALPSMGGSAYGPSISTFIAIQPY